MARLFNVLALGALLLTIGMATAPAPVAASEGVSIVWRAPADAELTADAAAPPLIRAVLLPDGADPAPQIRSHTSVALGDLPPQARGLPARELPDGTVYPPLGGFGAPAPADAPVSLLREGRLRGQRIAVYAINPIYATAGGAYRTLAVSALIPAARALPDLADLMADGGPFLSAAPGPSPLANRPGWLIRVSRGGMQALTPAALAAAGLNLSGVNPSLLHLRRNGAVVALEEIRSGGALSELRFYAPEPGDRWNATDTYWLTLEQTAGLRVTTRSAAPTGGATVSSTAYARGTWRDYRSFEPRLPGRDGDHFFAADMRVAPPEAGAPAEPFTVTVTLAPPLPLAAGPATLTPTGASVLGGDHRLQVRMGGGSQERSWSGDGDWAFGVSLPAAASAEVGLLPGSAVDRVHLDSVDWELPVRLTFGGRGAAFVGRGGRWQYQLSSLPAGAALYDVSDPARPQRLSIGAGAFEDNQTPAHSYLLAGPGTIQTPAIVAHQPVDMAAARDATAVYIAPAAWLSALEPLLAHRRAQGGRVVAISTESIYAGWGHGQVSPEAIRSFLRYAAATWPQAPTSLTLVGDGTSDPRNYLGTGQTSWVPPYLAWVDPWLGETACESCFAQLDGDSPLDDVLPDMEFGRLPAKSAEELGALITKIIGYERSAASRWQARVAYIADNADGAGDFAQALDASAAAQPAGVAISRVYYDPDPPAGEPWRERDPSLAFERTLDAFNNGAAVLVYAGHGLQYQWGVTGPPIRPLPNPDSAPRFLLNVDYAGDTVNDLRLPISLSMTCLTGAFQTPAVRGTTIDEALVLNRNGGAIAAWGSSGLGVLYGHDKLMDGFFRALWAAAPGQARLGALTMGGYLELFGAGGCCEDSVRTFALFGDPLTRVQARPDAAGVREVFLPLVRR